MTKKLDPVTRNYDHAPRAGAREFLTRIRESRPSADASARWAG